MFGLWWYDGDIGENGGLGVLFYGGRCGREGGWGLWGVYVRYYLVFL